MSEPILGIDLGTTNSAVGVVESGFPILLANTENQRIIPSAVWYGENGEIEVGCSITPQGCKLRWHHHQCQTPHWNPLWRCP